MSMDGSFAATTRLETVTKERKTVVRNPFEDENKPLGRTGHINEELKPNECVLSPSVLCPYSCSFCLRRSFLLSGPSQVRSGSSWMCPTTRKARGNYEAQNICVHGGEEERKGYENRDVVVVVVDEPKESAVTEPSTSVIGWIM